MPELKHNRVLLKIIYTIFFVLCFIYLAVFNRYHILFQEQSQLCVFSLDYFKSFLIYPGGFSSYIGAFFTQFFISPFAGAIILTAAGVLIYFFSDYIFKKRSINGIIFSMIPVLLHLALASDYRYTFALSAGFIFSLGFSAFYYSVQDLDRKSVV